MRAVFLDSDTVDRNDVDMSVLTQVLPDWQFYRLTSPTQLHERIADAEVIVTNKVILDAAAFAAAPKLKLVCVAATGTNNIDLTAAKRHGVIVCNVRAYSTPSVVQHVFGFMLSLTMKLNDYQQAVSRGDWQNSPYFCVLDYPINELAGKTLGIVGYGELGKAVEKVALAFGMNVLIAQRKNAPATAGRIPLNELLPQVDVLTLHCPLTEDTRNLISHAELALMKPSALLLNTARGGVVDEHALADALRQKRLAGAGVDVLTKEPPAADHPLLQADIPNLILTPHIAWASVQARQRLVAGIADNIRGYLQGNVRNNV